MSCFVMELTMLIPRQSPSACPLWIRCFQKPEKNQAVDSLWSGKKKISGCSLWLLSASWILQQSTTLLKSLFCGPRQKAFEEMGRFSALPKKAISHPTTISPGELIRQQPVQPQLHEIQAAGINSSAELEKCNQVWKGARPSELTEAAS